MTSIYLAFLLLCGHSGMTFAFQNGEVVKSGARDVSAWEYVLRDYKPTDFAIRKAVGTFGKADVLFVKYAGSGFKLTVLEVHMHSARKAESCLTEVAMDKLHPGKALLAKYRRKETGILFVSNGLSFDAMDRLSNSLVVAKKE